ncbi:hypothetical protein KKB18_05830, partial [bacterium]|nr:hypothetical protein [bacterium]
MLKKSFIILLFCSITSIFTLTNAYSQLADSPWPMFMHDPQHTGRSEYKGPDYPIIKWEFEAKSEYTPPPIVIGPDGTIYAISVSLIDSIFYAINPDGTLKWQISMGNNCGSSAPIIGLDGTIY